MDPRTADLVRAWAVGWAVSRRKPRPTERPWGLYIDVAEPELAGRHVVERADESCIRDACASVTTGDVWLEVPGPLDEVAERLPAGWRVDPAESGHLMAAELGASAAPAPGGYALTTTEEDDVTYVRVLDATGAVAAHGQLAVVGRTAVVDRVRTEEAHRRRGLGSLVMRTLTDRALARGAEVGVLGASDAGRALYETLGWTRHSPLAACAPPPVRPGTDGD
ncbi:GNAT family N-acetyltransferase [Streptacidiphilus pinicola]|uniref:GNAT family N-acetyltransferase n=1 Tax=Streptacidiphilus pinicola TaxID=2219663 RepID=A0A2X0IZV6_9ACTN|nr:GNAT family N-acetyltransferase [Streptacidiphilus pinicola]RAG83476.1 GNAT family N-acetyltransferase [Streptacidiphilus pinicola]